MLQGGILWRLYVDAMGYEREDLQELDFLDQHVGFDQEVIVDGKRYLEAVVAPHDEDILCGVYKQQGL